MKINFVERYTEYLISLLLLGLTIYLLREVWVSVQVLEIIYQQLLDGTVFTEGPPIQGVERYLFFCLCSAPWFLLVLASINSKRSLFLWFGWGSFYFLPIWVLLYLYINERTYYDMIGIWDFMLHQVLFSWNLLLIILSMAVAAAGVRLCQFARNR